jgi:hypothetical protein
LPHPIRPAFLDNLAGVERDRQPDPKKLSGGGCDETPLVEREARSA